MFIVININLFIIKIIKFIFKFIKIKKYYFIETKMSNNLKDKKPN